MKSLLFLLIISILPAASRSQDTAPQSQDTASRPPDTGSWSQDLVTDLAGPGTIPVVSATHATAIYVDTADYWLVQKAAALLQEDIERVTGRRPRILHTLPASAENLIIIGSLDRSPLIGRLAKEHRLSSDSLKGQWEAYSLQNVSHPARGIGQALVITGSDRRGTAFGIFELSRQMGVSPWYWWADVPVRTRPAIYVDCRAWKKDHPAGFDHPAVKYRGFFINDEAPCLSGWAREKFGGLNHTFYEKVFELLLRLKANYLWPAMWGNAFNDDDTLNPVLADKYGIVMGTSHHEPMLRAQQEWKRYGAGPWNYSTNPATLQAFWKKGIEHMGTHESIVTIGMRGDGDMPMTEGSNIALLENIVRDQRKIIGDVTGKDPSATPQSWALYKEVQDYYDKGMRVPDDVTLLLCDDNWGNIRKLPPPGAKPRAGGYGMYYHFDYVGDPRNYKWLNTNPIPRVWEQMHLTYQYGVDRIWIVNVGDIKPMEFPIQFFLDYAWDPALLPADSLDAYTRQWAARQFGPEHAATIAAILTAYAKYNGRRKPELLSPDTYSLLHYREAETITSDYNALAETADSIYKLLPASYRDAYYQLVLYPVLACANLNELYTTVARNRLYAAQGNIAANALAERAKALFANDSILSRYYNKEMAGGKWDHMMDQTHIGYTYWQQPPVNSMPEVKTLDPSAIRDSTATGASHTAGDTSATGVSGTSLPSRESATPRPSMQTTTPGFTESDGYVSIEAEHYTRAIGSATTATPTAAGSTITWQRIPGLGRTLSAMEADPVTAPTQTPGGASPHLEYVMHLSDTGTIKVYAYFSPTLDFSGKGLYYGISFDDEAPQIVDLHITPSTKPWETAVADNIIIRSSNHRLSNPGYHTLKFWMVDPGVVLQKIVVDAGGMQPSYLGPPESDRLTGLKDSYRNYFPIGVAVSPRSLTGPDSALILREFNSLTPENAMKMGPIHPEEGRYNWKDADLIVNFAQAHGLRVRGHNLCWHEQTPPWLFIDSQGRQVSKEVLLQRLKDHITAVVSRYKGKVYAWDVVNEAIDDDSTKQLRNSPWYRICGDEYIAKAFEYAHQADPGAQLFYNDYNTERPEKRERVYKLLKQLVTAGVPITGIGLQGHWSVYEPSEKELREAIDRFSSLGLKVQITELDISIYPWEKYKRARRPGEPDTYTPELERLQGEQYRKVFSVFRDYKGILNGITFWNVSDRHTWLDEYPVPGRKNYPLLFDTNGQPKKAYRGVVNFKTPLSPY